MSFNAFFMKQNDCDRFMDEKILATITTAESFASASASSLSSTLPVLASSKNKRSRDPNEEKVVLSEQQAEGQKVLNDADRMSADISAFWIPSAMQGLDASLFFLLIAFFFFFVPER